LGALGTSPGILGEIFARGGECLSHLRDFILKTQLDWQFRDFGAIIQPFTDSSSHPNGAAKTAGVVQLQGA
jgi:hypothetical protein